MKPNSTVKEQSLHPTTTGTAHARPADTVTVDTDLDDRIILALQAAGEKKAIDLTVLDLREIASFTDFFVITSGSNERQVQAISDGVVETLKKNGSNVARVEGYKSAEWILLDYGDFVVHVFDEKARKFYDLERLWRESKRVSVPSEIAGPGDSSLRNES
jgi:ribosome-associated protein